MESEQDSAPSRSANAARGRNQRRDIASSLIGRQAPLGFRGAGPAEPRTETSPNDGASMARQEIGEVVEERSEAAGGDLEVRRPAPRGRQNGTRSRNVHLPGHHSGELDFNADTNNPSTRFDLISRGYGTLSRVVETFRETLLQPPGPPRGIMSVVNDYAATAAFHGNATREEDRLFYGAAMGMLRDELNSFRTGEDRTDDEARE